MTIIQAIILAIVEGITEFLPISSTGHMIIASTLMGIQSDQFVKMFTVAIQFGAILSVVVLYFQRFFQSWTFYAKLFCAFLPTAILGLLLNDYIEQLLESVTTVAFMLLIGGIFLLFVDKWFEKNNHLPDAEPTYKQAVGIGLIQAVSMVPGVSRSAATIIGGMVHGLNRKAAAEFSFLLAVPTMFAATAKSLYDQRELLLDERTSLMPLVVGNIVAFVVAMLAIRFFIRFLTVNGFKFFGYYRIAVGILLLVLIYSGYIQT